jgi:hypothetical protein
LPGSLKLFQLADLWIRENAVRINLHATDRRLAESELGLDPATRETKRGQSDCSSGEPPDICCDCARHENGLRRRTSAYKHCCAPPQRNRTGQKLSVYF